MGRSPCCDKVGLKKGPWTPEEDHKLIAFIDRHGHGSWRALPAKAALQRCGKSCRLRWTNYLRPDIKRGQFSLHEEQTIIQLHALLGNRWSAIATHLPKRTDNEIKNYWNTRLKKRLTKMGIDPVTHKPCSGTLCATAGLSHMAQWESIRLEAEAHLVRESNKLLSPNLNNNNKYKTSAASPPCLDVLKAWQAQLTSLSSPSGSTNKDQAASAFSSLITGFSGAGESPTSTFTFPLGGGAGFPAMTDDVSAMTNMNMNIPMLPLNDMSYEAGNAWFNSNEDMQNDVVGNGFPDFLVGGTNDVVESYENGTVTGHHGTRFVGEENKNYWNNVLINLVTINASSSSVSPPPSGAVFCRLLINN